MTPLVGRIAPKRAMSLRILDPAMGKGNFLREAANFLCRELARRTPEIKPDEKHRIKQAIFRDCLFGIDTDARAVEEARESLGAEGDLDAEGREELATHLVVGNSLLDPFPIKRRRRFDVVLGNPPYVGFKFWSEDKPFRQFLRENYQCFNWHADLFYFFIERGLKLLARGGRMGFVTSRYFMRSPSAAKLRALALPHMTKFIDLHDTDAFAELGVHCAISIYAQSPTKARTHAAPRDVPTFDVPTVPLADVAEVRAGLQSGRDAVYVTAISREGDGFYGAKPDGKRIELEPDLIYPFIKNRDIQPYGVTPSRYCLFVGDGLDPSVLRQRLPKSFRFLASHREQLLSRRSSFKEVTEKNWTQWMHWTDLHFSKTRIVCPYRAASNRFALAPPGALGSIDVGFIVPRDMDPLYLLALLNSRLFERIFQSYAKELGRGVYDYYPKTLGQLPIRTIPTEIAARYRHLAVAEFKRAFDAGKGLPWLSRRRAPEVLHDVLVLLARDLSGKRPSHQDEIAGMIECAVDALYRLR